MTHTPRKPVPQIDYIALEQDARRLRAEAFGRAMTRFFRWATRRPAPQGDLA